MKKKKSTLAKYRALLKAHRKLIKNPETVMFKVQPGFTMELDIEPTAVRVLATIEQLGSIHVLASEFAVTIYNRGSKPIYLTGPEKV